MGARERVAAGGREAIEIREKTGREKGRHS